MDKEQKQKQQQPPPSPTGANKDKKSAGKAKTNGQSQQDETTEHHHQQQPSDKHQQPAAYDLASFTGLNHGTQAVVVDPVLQGDPSKGNQSNTYNPGPVTYTQQYGLIIPPGSHPFVITPATAPTQAVATSVPPQSNAGADEHEEPLYVNAKQYHRILKRRAARAKLEAENKIARGRKKYLHESRHKHAMRRPRGPGGRFLTATEIADMEQKKEDENGNSTGSPMEIEQQQTQGSIANLMPLSDNSVKKENHK